MTDPHRDWLRRELPDLVRGGVIDRQTAERIDAHYAGRLASPGAAVRWTVAALGVLGALLVVGGIILLIAHNWDSLGRPARLGITVGQLVAAQVLGAYVVLRRRESTAWREAAGGVCALAVAASIALVSQTYHIPGELSDFLLTCCLLTVPLMYLFDAQVPAGLFWVALVVRAIEGGGWTMRDRMSAVNWILAALAVPFLVMLARRAEREWRLLATVVAVSLLPLGIAQLSGAGQSGALYVAGILALLHALGTTGAPDERWRTGPRIVARIGLTVFGLIGTFDFFWREGRGEWPPSQAGAVTVVIGLLAGAAAVWLARRTSLENLLLSCAIAPALLGYLLAAAELEGGAQVVVNVFVAAVGISFLARGFRTLSAGVVNYGLLLLTALAIMRFVDTDLGFLVRGIGFIVVGLGFLGANLALMRRRREAAP